MGQTRSLPQCKYGSDCYQKNPVHLGKFSHPKDHVPGKKLVFKSTIHADCLMTLPRGYEHKSDLKWLCIAERIGKPFVKNGYVYLFGETSYNGCTYRLDSHDHNHLGTKILLDGKAVKLRRE